MAQGPVLDTVRRVEEAPLRDLVSVGIDAVQVQMDHLLEPEIDSASLYRRWEAQQWAVSDLDFSVDRQHWQAMDGAVRRQVRRTMTLFFIGEQAVTDTLAPILHAAPAEDERIFLATQIADEARHTVFFQRFFEEVLEIHGGLHAALEAVADHHNEGFRSIFENQLADATDRVRREPGDGRAWVEAVVTYHLVIEGYLALTGQRTLLRIFRAAGLMPGFSAGFTAVARDESRHIGFGVMALRRRVMSDREMGRVIALKLLELVAPAVATATGRGERIAVEDPNLVPSVLRVNPLETRDFAISSLAKRLRAAGLSSGAVAEIERRMGDEYESNWRLYESTYGARHPVSYYRDGLVA